MIQWVQSKVLLPEIILAGVLLLGGTLPDFLIQGASATLTGLAFVASAFFLRKYQYIAIAFTVAGATLEVALSLQPLITGVLTVILVLFSATFSPRRWAILYATAIVAAGIAVIAHTSFDSVLLSNIYGLAIFSEQGRWSAFFVMVLVELVIVATASLIGALVSIRFNERKLQRERTAIDEHQIRLAIDLAEQNERMGIARDLNQVTTQQLSSSIAMVEGARYAARLDAQVAVRSLERLEKMLRESHTELQQVQDALSHGVSIAPAAPNLFDLDALMVQFRELGYNCTLTHEGKVRALIDSAELNIYRIVFDALNNVRQHAPKSTHVSVDLTWHENGLQVLIKDDGLETARKIADLEIAGSYNVNDDLNSLLREVDGVGIRTMRERAELIGGSLEAKVVPGVGFTINAIFPDLASVAK